MKIKPSHKDFQKYADLVQAIHLATNPHVYFNGYIRDEITGERFLELSDVKLIQLKETLESILQDMIKDFEYDFIDEEFTSDAFENYVNNSMPDKPDTFDFSDFIQGG